MKDIKKMSKLMALIFAAGLAQVPMQGHSQEKEEDLIPPLFVELPEQASGPLGGANIAQVLVLTKQGKLKTFYGRSISSFESVSPAPPGTEIRIENVDDPGKDIIVTATIPRSSLVTPTGETGPIEVIPSILIKVGNSTCGWNYYSSGGSGTCQKVCY
jgi:hypothetical protein